MVDSWSMNRKEKKEKSSFCFGADLQSRKWKKGRYYSICFNFYFLKPLHFSHQLNLFCTYTFVFTFQSNCSGIECTSEEEFQELFCNIFPAYWPEGDQKFMNVPEQMWSWRWEIVVENHFCSNALITEVEMIHPQTITEPGCCTGWSYQPGWAFSSVVWSTQTIFSQKNIWTVIYKPHP